jgi:CDP-paratose 2-epimerase
MSAPCAFIAGSCGLIGSQVSLHFNGPGFRPGGPDNQRPAAFVGRARHPRWIAERPWASELEPTLNIDALVQPSQDRAAAVPFDDFNATAPGSLKFFRAAQGSSS